MLSIFYVTLFLWCLKSVNKLFYYHFHFGLFLFFFLSFPSVSFFPISTSIFVSWNIPHHYHLGQLLFHPFFYSELHYFSSLNFCPSSGLPLTPRFHVVPDAEWSPRPLGRDCGRAGWWHAGLRHWADADAWGGCGCPGLRFQVILGSGAEERVGAAEVRLGVQWRCLVRS